MLSKEEWRVKIQCILNKFGYVACSLTTIAGVATGTSSALIILDVLVSLMTFGLLLAVTLVPSRTSFALSIVNISGYVAHALRVTFVGPSRWTVVACSASRRVFACALCVATAVVYQARVHG